MKHWRTEINFEAYDEEDAERMIQRMLAPIDAERRLLFATTPEQTTEYHTGQPDLPRPTEHPQGAKDSSWPEVDEALKAAWESE